MHTLHGICDRVNYTRIDGPPRTQRAGLVPARSPANWADPPTPQVGRSAQFERVERVEVPTPRPVPSCAEAIDQVQPAPTTPHEASETNDEAKVA